MQQNIDAQIKHKTTCQVIGLIECEQETEDPLTGPAVAGGPTLATTLESRDGHEYLTLRGNEEVSVLVGVRSAVADGIERALWNRREEGEYRAKKVPSSGLTFAHLLLRSR